MTKLQRSAAVAGFVVLAALATAPAHSHPLVPETTRSGLPVGGFAALAVGLLGLAARRRV